MQPACKICFVSVCKLYYVSKYLMFIINLIIISSHHHYYYYHKEDIFRKLFILIYTYTLYVTVTYHGILIGGIFLATV